MTHWEPWVLAPVALCEQGAPCITGPTTICRGCIGDGRRVIVEGVVSALAAIDADGTVFGLTYDTEGFGD